MPGSVADGLVRSQPVRAYGDAIERHAAELADLTEDVRRIERWRVVTFLVTAIVGSLYRDLPTPPWLALTVAGLSAVAFVGLVVRQRALRRAIRRTEVAHALARIGELRIRRRWDELGDAYGSVGYSDPLLEPEASEDEAHPYVRDLDMFGPASVRALLGPTPTPTGVATLRSWLSEPAPVPETQRRQSMVRSLAPDFSGREALAIESLLVERFDESAWAAFRRWLSEPAIFGGHEAPVGLPQWSILFARLMPPITLTLFSLDMAGMAVSAWSWIAPLIMQSAFAWRWGTVLHPYFERGSRRAPGLRRHHTLLEAWEEYESESTAVGELQRRLVGESGVRASVEIRSLEKWLEAADSRASMLHFVFAAAGLWDVHVAWGLERWRERAGAHVEDWFDALGELEALASLATLAHDHPDWAWPEFRDGTPGFEAEGLGHPLLSETVLRTSDVRLDPPGRFLLVTGSNMSGKSTLLRSIGLAAVLAQAGAVVCATRVSLTPLRTFSSMRIQDSLTAGVSLFMAELNRLKALVDAAGDGVGDARALLYLVDEVLQGTNSDERRIAARRIVSHLLDRNAIGAVTTHDLSLHEDQRLEPVATKVHFREHVGDEGEAVLTFDYKLRPGLATSRNALKLLEIVGLGDGARTRETDRG